MGDLYNLISAREEEKLRTRTADFVVFETREMTAAQDRKLLNIKESEHTVFKENKERKLFDKKPKDRDIREAQRIVDAVKSVCPEVSIGAEQLIAVDNKLRLDMKYEYVIAFRRNYNTGKKYYTIYSKYDDMIRSLIIPEHVYKSLYKMAEEDNGGAHVVMSQPQATVYFILSVILGYGFCTWHKGTCCVLERQECGKTVEKTVAV